MMKINKENLVGKSIQVFAPATVANLVCGFDILGLALEQPGDEVVMRLVEQPGVRLVKIEGDSGLLPTDAEKNTVSASVMDYLNHLKCTDLGVEIELFKKMPIGSGLGSSSASTVAGLFAINNLLNEPLSRLELLPFAIRGEALACGHGHADNVAPALIGGISLIRGYAPLDVVSLPVPAQLWIAVVFPDVEVPTRGARQMIQKKVELKQAVQQWGNIAGLVSGLFMEDYDLIGRSMQDVLIEPVRSILIPEFTTMRRLAMEAGALSFGISGSGPSVFACCKTAGQAQTINKRIQQHMDAMGIDCLTYASRVNTEGPKVCAVSRAEASLTIPS